MLVLVGLLSAKKSSKFTFTTHVDTACPNIMTSVGESETTVIVSFLIAGSTHQQIIFS